MLSVPYASLPALRVRFHFNVHSRLRSRLLATHFSHGNTDVGQNAIYYFRR